jgi:hypothetical protein
MSSHSIGKCIGFIPVSILVSKTSCPGVSQAAAQMNIEDVQADSENQAGISDTTSTKSTRIE